MSNTKKGKYGEEVAVQFLKKKGFSILERNFHYSKYGEIDIIAKKNGVIHAIEVKARTNLIFGEPAEAVTPIKLMRIQKTLMYYIKTLNKFYNFQIDVISILFDKDTKSIDKIEFLENIEF